MTVIEYFPYFGPNRRSDKPVVEIMLSSDPDDGQSSTASVSGIKTLLHDGGVLTPGEHFPEQALPVEPQARYASLLVQTALLLQRKAGHRVDFFSVLPIPHRDRCIALLEHEHCDVAMTAVKLADELVSGKRKSLTEPFRSFCEFANERLLSIETEAIIKAASLLDIPCIQLEHYPYSGGKRRATCIRRNGLLMLGHGAQHHVLDGTFCLDKSGDRLNALLRNGEQRRAVLEGLGLPLATTGNSGSAVKGIFQIFAINGQVTAAVHSTAGRVRAVDNLHSSVLDMSLAISREVEGFPVLITLQATEVSKPLTQAGGCVVDFELGPDLERLAGQSNLDSQLLDGTVVALLEWLFPDQGSARMPIIAVTGTNGKTTTTRMIGKVMMTAGHKPGMVSTDGIFLNGKQASKSDASSLIGHTSVLTNKDVDVAVLESHHRGIFIRGFAFQWCDIAVSLNVTDDHLDDVHIRSVEEMGIIKRALLERARYAAILNADNEHCLNMLTYVDAQKTCLVSMQSGVNDLRVHTAKRAVCFCVLESVDGHDWVVIYDQDRLPVMPVASMPATFEGLARFNVSNAMHAIAACHLSGIDLSDIKTGMASFNMSFENTPGRLNFYEDHPFRVLMDFAHNTHGMHRLCEFVERIEVSGRKFLMLQARGDIEDKYVRGIATAAAGHFDHYVCRSHPLHPGPVENKAPDILKAALLDAGVGEQQVTVTTDPMFAVDTMLKMGSAGDLLVFTPGSGQPRIDTWGRVISFNSETSGQR